MELPSPPKPPVEPAPIRRLDVAVVNRIAAGEVIQRPASALKELLENSLDAGATNINVIVKDGGLKLIQISDNGHGIRYEDLPLLCERHTTSKLRDYDDLQSINTLGFRGEALASMTFVAHLSVTTMTAGKTHGYKVSYKDGVMEGDPRPCAAVKGTQILVENLFYNVVARKKAFKNPSEEYGRIVDVISRYAIHRTGASFSCKKHGDSRADVYTVVSSSRLDAIRSVYGPGVARDLIAVTASSDDETSSTFKMDGFISSANYSAKKTVMVLFINDRLVECAPLKKAIEVVYTTILPKASKPFLYVSIIIPPAHVDVNVHPTKREVSFLNQENLVDTIQRVVEAKLLDSNNSRTFYTQTLIPGASTTVAKEKEATPTPSIPRNYQKAPVNKLVRTDALQPAGQLHSFLQKKTSGPSNAENDLAVTRKVVRQRRNPRESADLTSIQELLASVDQETHSGLLEIVKNCIYVGMADDNMALVQYKTYLYLINVYAFSKELMYQQVLRRFAHFLPMQLSSLAPLQELFMVALDREEVEGRWHESDGPKAQIAKLNSELLQCKAEMIKEYFSLEIDDGGHLRTLPVILDQYFPDMERLPSFVLNLGNNVDWETEKECFESFSAALAEFYAVHTPSLPNPSGDGIILYQRLKNKLANTNDKSTETDNLMERNEDVNSKDTESEDLLSEAQTIWAQREWTVQHVLFPAMKLFLKPPRHMAKDGSAIQVACLENLYKIFERC
ncbi:DNA mismatch repair protein MLH1 [Marchantia polymorpha subsp. ruderalis]|uniref:DNA mismatch repair protein S5 domain-containing protein n=2 Tax=Marchantia polymorpha TaxID=3197 RepID=A0AAF6BGB6_MARPO|nr:hypothetical protein MARPO_0086s0067 [Marchantia polymorpha]PTQ33749.1 hypothetical protein MARPO_0086s0067 [Marchantia polymorpha]BBN11049.1 hypothetical protein Mp_5g08620 [Marchantia polymorpha subsp. ruderalis]BBN11050.1 hypothetical protein Mp_5g08620 [Marchantia polymorpha subsp. ruderalis]|eukprot:PTQ33748.1 hypothetical protein MARPO_0086s0067 [Marchantia polymorpha]